MLFVVLNYPVFIQLLFQSNKNTGHQKPALQHTLTEIDEVNIIKPNRKFTIDYKYIQNPYIILIGISHYTRKAKYRYRVKDLSGVQADIKKLRKVFVKKFGDNNIATIPKDLNNNERMITKSHINSRFLTIRAKINEINENNMNKPIDGLILYYAD